MEFKRSIWLRLVFLPLDHVSKIFGENSQTGDGRHEPALADAALSDILKQLQEIFEVTFSNRTRWQTGKAESVFDKFGVFEAQLARVQHIDRFIQIRRSKSIVLT